MLAASKFNKTWPSIVFSEPLVGSPWQRGIGEMLQRSPRNAESFRIKRRAFRLFPPDGGLLVSPDQRFVYSVGIRLISIEHVLGPNTADPLQ